MLNYHFEHREPMRWRIALALQVEVKRRKEQIWVGNEMEGGARSARERGRGVSGVDALAGRVLVRGQVTTSADDWTAAFWALCRALTAQRAAERTKQETDAVTILSQLAEEHAVNAAAWYAAMQIWEMYLRCCRGLDRKKAQTVFRQFAELLLLPFGEYTPEMLQWRREKPVTMVWNNRSDAKLEI